MPYCGLLYADMRTDVRVELSVLRALGPGMIWKRRDATKCKGVIFAARKDTSGTKTMTATGAPTFM